MKKYAIIVAGGRGTRMGNDLPKQFILINGKPILYHTLKVFLESFDDMQVILVLPEEYISAGQEIIDAYFNYDRIRLCGGGTTRFHSVQQGLSLVEEEAIIFVHDAVRCLLTTSLIRRCYEAANETGTAVPVISCTDSVRLLRENENEFFPRQDVKMVQTPQVFHSKILQPAYNIDYKEKYTDEASVVDAFGMKLTLVDGEENNIKITTPRDLIVAEYILNSVEN